MNLSRSKQKNARALNPRSLLSLEKKTRKKKKKKKKGTPRVVDRRGVLLLPQTEPDPSFVRFCFLRAFVLEQKKRLVFSRDFFGGGGKKKKGKNVSLQKKEEEEEGQKKNMKSVLLARFELAISRLLSGRLNRFRLITYKTAPHR